MRVRGRDTPSGGPAEGTFVVQNSTPGRALPESKGHLSLTCSWVGGNHHRSTAETLCSCSLLPPPSQQPVGSLSPCLCLRIPLYSLLISLSTLHRDRLFFLSLCLFLSLPLYLLVFCLPVFSVFLHNPHTLSTFSFPGRSPSLTPSLGLWVSGLWPMSPAQTTSGQSITLGTEARRRAPGGSREALHGSGLQAAAAALTGRWVVLPTLRQETPGRATQGRCP